MFKRLLVANRGEIAVRVIRTARQMGIHTIALYSDADSTSLAVRMADEAYHLPGNKPAESYLHIEKIIAIAHRSKADAIHPGYGFLSENAEFADRCQQEGFIFVGPPASAIRAMGSKSAAKDLMQQAKVPVVEGYQGADQSIERFAEAAAKIGYPVLLKAVMGGGGKGMRVVENAADMGFAIEQVKREARASFNDDVILIEKYLNNPRHIEVQIFADTLGHAVYLFERDCSIQRRHQKIIEEAPGIGITDETRSALGKAAVEAVRAIDYVGAGTIEFLLDEAQRFYFMEMNTRLQVEHPVTELITGLDLVEWQLRVAAGEALPLTQSEIRFNGHAIEARICAEDPMQSFLPQTGKINALLTPDARIDSGVEAGSEISVYYDSMIAKLIVHGGDRQTAIYRMQEALAHYHLFGLKTNISFLQNVFHHEAYLKGEISTGFIGAELHSLVQQSTPLAVLAIAGITLMQPKIGWDNQDAWQCNLPAVRWFRFKDKHREYRLSARVQKNQHASFYTIICEQQTLICSANLLKTENGYHLALLADGMQTPAEVVILDNELQIVMTGRQYSIQSFPFGEFAGLDEDAQDSLVAPMPGAIIAVKTSVGQRVAKGDVLIVLEAMKMEHALKAPHDGIVTDVYHHLGEMVQEGKILLKLSDVQ